MSVCCYKLIVWVAGLCSSWILHEDDTYRRTAWRGEVTLQDSAPPGFQAFSPPCPRWRDCGSSAVRSLEGSHSARKIMSLLRKSSRLFAVDCTIFSASFSGDDGFCWRTSSERCKNCWIPFVISIYEVMWFNKMSFYLGLFINFWLAFSFLSVSWLPFC